MLINGSLKAELSLFRGLRQRGPMSPFIFILVMQGLYGMVQEAVETNLICGVIVGSQ